MQLILFLVNHFLLRTMQQILMNLQIELYLLRWLHNDAKASYCVRNWPKMVISGIVRQILNEAMDLVISLAKEALVAITADARVLSSRNN